MDDRSFEYMKLQYEEGARTIRYWIECRYKILQFAGYFNAAVLTLGFSQKILLSEGNAAAGISICVLSLLVALMGLATEFSTSSYNYGYFEYLRMIEKELGTGPTKGIFTHARKINECNSVHRKLPVHRAHKIFYFVLIGFWITLLVLQIARRHVQ